MRISFPFRYSFLVLAVAAGIARPAAAQDRAFVGGMGGVTFNTVSGGIFAGQGGVHIGGGLFVIGEVGRAQNVLPKELADQLDDAAEFIEAQVGLPVNLSLDVPATYAFGGIRWVAPGERRVRPFVEGGAGMAHLVADIDVSVGGLPVPIGEIGDLDDLGLTTNEFLLALGGGVNIGLTRAVSLDVGYRYLRVFVEDQDVAEVPGVNTSAIYAGIKIGFGG